MNGPIEPSALMRQLAATLYEEFTALTQAGFTETQALTIIGQMLAAGAIAHREQDEDDQ